MTLQQDDGRVVPFPAPAPQESLVTIAGRRASLEPYFLDEQRLAERIARFVYRSFRTSGTAGFVSPIGIA